MDPLNKKYYKIGEVAEILHLPPSTLRYWESQFTLIKPRRNAKGTRFYTSDDIEKIAMIHYLVKQKGLKIDAAQEQLRANPHGVERQSRAIVRLRAIRAELVELLDALKKRRQ